LVRSLIVEGSLLAMKKPAKRSVSSVSGSVKSLAVTDPGMYYTPRSGCVESVNERFLSICQPYFVVVGSPPFVIETAAFM
jgi:hypothetical protein